MKKKYLWIFCAVSTAVFAQQPTGERPQRQRPSQNQDGEAQTGQFQRQRPGQNMDGQAPMGQEAQQPLMQDQAPDADQATYDNLMGTFGDLAMQFSQQDTRDIEVFVYECKYIGAEAFSQALEPFLSVNGEIADTEDSDLVIIQDDSKNIQQLKDIAAAIDRPIRQVLVSASVVEFQISDGFEKDISLQYSQFVNMDDASLSPLPGGAGGTPASAFATRILDALVPSGANPATLSGTSGYIYYNPEEQSIFSAFLTFLETKGTARILSSPSLVMRRGHTGNILSGEDIPITESNVGSGGTSFSVEYKSVGIKLRVTPESIFDERVVLEVSPEVSNIIRYEESSAGRNPVIAIRNASTMLEMNDGQMVSIGGLLREEKIETEKRIPILSSIPIIGTLFRGTSSEEIRSQLVIFLTVNIVDPEEMDSNSIKPSEVTPELQEKIDASNAAIIPSEDRSFFKDLFLLFK